MRISDWSSDVCSSDLAAHQLGGDVGLDVGEADHEVRRELQDLVDLRAVECADLGLFLARPRRAHGEAADADDPVLLAERVQHLGGLLGQADDALRADGPRHGYSIRFVHAPATTSPSYSQRSCRRESPAYQNSMEYGRTRRPVQRGGRGTSRPSNSATTSASACSNAS